MKSLLWLPFVGLPALLTACGSDSPPLFDEPGSAGGADAQGGATHSGGNGGGSGGDTPSAGGSHAGTAGEPGAGGESSGGNENSGGVGASSGEAGAGTDHSGGSGGHSQGGTGGHSQGGTGGHSEGGDDGNGGEGAESQGGDDGNGGEGGSSVEIDDCPGNSCLHGSCVDGIDTYSCSCDDGWTGSLCDSNIDDCPGNSCLHGSCVDGIDTYSCSCDDGWTGSLCDSNIDDCPGNSCLHGSCVDGIDTYSCSCDDGWTGSLCDSNIDDCADDPCDHGECADATNGFTCSCDIGWTGASCDTCEVGYSGADCDTCSSGYYDNGNGCVWDPLSEVCVGTTSVNGWSQYSSTTVTRLVDTSACAFQQAPLYFTSVYGSSMHWTAKGVSAIYTPTASSFRTYLAEDFSFSVQDAQNNGWQVAWAAVENGIHGDRLCTGQTDPTTTDWTDYAAGTVYTDVNLSDCAFSTAPRIFTSLGGDAGHFTAFGVTSIYTPTATGFRVYVTQQSLSAAQAEASNCFVNWMAVDPTLQSNVACSGQTATGTTNWQAYNSDIYTDVSTSACNFSHTPVFLTTLGGASNHFLTTGANALYGTTASGFRTYIDYVNNSMSPAVANSLQWRMEWIGF